MPCNNCDNCINCVQQCNCPDPCIPESCDDGCIIDVRDTCTFTTVDIEICGTTYPSGTNQLVINEALRDCLVAGVPAANDVFVKISANDTTTGYLEDKLLGSNCLTVTKNNIGANEELIISPTVSAQAGNIIQCLADGLYATASSLTPTTQAIVNQQNTDTINTTVSFNGTETYTVSADARIASGGIYADNILQSITGNGMYVAPSAAGVATSILQCNTSSTITQTVTAGVGNFTICNEVDIASLIDGGGLDATNCLTLQGGKLRIDCPTITADSYVSNVAMVNGELDFDGVGSAFANNVNLISTDTVNGIIAGTDNALFSPGLSADAGNALVIGADNGFFVPVTASQVMATLNDTCPGTLDDKLTNDIATLNPTGLLQGVGGFTWSTVEVDPTCTGANNVNGIVSLTIDGIVYLNLSGIAITVISDIVDTFQWIIDNNAALSGAATSSSSATVPGIPPLIQDLYITGQFTTVVVDYNVCSNGINSAIVQVSDISANFDANLILPEFKNVVYKQVLNAGACEQIEMFTYNAQEVETTCASPSSVTASFYDNNTKVYVQTVDALADGEYFVVNITNTSSGVDIVNNLVIKPATAPAFTGVSLPGYTVGNLSVTIRRSCGNGLSSSIGTTLLSPAVTSCDTNGWQPLPVISILSDWVTFPDAPAMYKIENDVLELRGALSKPITVATPGAFQEDMVNIQLIDNCPTLDATLNRWNGRLSEEDISGIGTPIVTGDNTGFIAYDGNFLIANVSASSSLGVGGLETDRHVATLNNIKIDIV